jgi:hypothetical protein
MQISNTIDQTRALFHQLAAVLRHFVLLSLGARRHKAGAEQPMLEQLRDPPRVLGVRLSFRHRIHPSMFVLVCCHSLVKLSHWLSIAAFVRKGKGLSETRRVVKGVTCVEVVPSQRETYLHYVPIPG